MACPNVLTLVPWVQGEDAAKGAVQLLGLISKPVYTCTATSMRCAEEKVHAG